MDFSADVSPRGPRSPVAGTPGRSKRLPSRRFQRQSAFGLINDTAQHFGSRNFDELMNLYSCPIQFYDALPNCTIDLADLERLAILRLRMLRVVERVNMTVISKYSQEWEIEIESQMQSDVGDENLAAHFAVKSLLLTPLPGLASASTAVIQEKKTANMNAMLNRELDHVSHFILRLAYAASDELRRWFVQHELDLFRYRASRIQAMDSVKSAGQAPCALSDVISTNGLEYQGVTLTEIRSQSSEDASGVEACNLITQNAAVPSSVYYRVPFTEALELVRSRRAFIKKGLAFVPDSEMVVLLCAIFRTSLTQSLAKTARVLPQLAEDDRISSFMTSLSRRYTGPDYGSQEINSDLLPTVTDGNIQSMVSGKPSPFPPCMLSLHKMLTESHHLKYKGRIQYGLFLKGIGLSLEHAIRFFRGHFTDPQGSVTTEKFDKEYVYGIRYNYGKEGKKVNWAPWNCMRTINDSVGSGDNHGCPFRLAEPKALASLLKMGGCESDAAVAEVLEMSRQGHYQKSCSLHFRHCHGGRQISSAIVSHPNQFYMESVRPPGEVKNRRLAKGERVMEYASPDLQDEAENEILSQLTD